MRPPRHSTPFAAVALAAVAAFAAAAPPVAAQGADPAFDATVPRPAYEAGAGPRLLVDAAHQNLHTLDGRYAAFGAVATSDGFRVEASAAAFTAEALPADAILVVANARGAAQPGDPAFTAAEMAAVRDWVAAGGSLFLIADHAPFGAAARQLAAAFGVRMLDGHVSDAANQAAELPGPAFLAFTREAGTLGDHAITAGRDDAERLRRVVTFGGQALEAPAGATVLLKLGPGAVSVADPQDTAAAPQTVGGLAQAVALEHGRGRVVIAGEAGLFGAQIIEGEAARRAGLDAPLRFGMNHPGTDDRQLLLNVLHWLARLL
jgi:hypothetical protein